MDKIFFDDLYFLGFDMESLWSQKYRKNQKEFL